MARLNSDLDSLKTYSDLHGLNLKLTKCSSALFFTSAVRPFLINKATKQQRLLYHIPLHDSHMYSVP